MLLLIENFVLANDLKLETHGLSQQTFINLPLIVTCVVSVMELIFTDIRNEQNPTFYYQ